MNNSKRLFCARPLLLSIGLLTVLSGAAFAQKAPAPQSQKATAPAAASAPDVSKQTKYDSWMLSCGSAPGRDGVAAKTCEVRADIVVQDEKSGQQALAMTIMFVRPMTEKTVQAVVRLPLAAYLNFNPRLMGSDGKPIAEYNWVACQPQLCGAAVAMTDAQLGLIRKIGDKFTVLYRNQLGQDIRIDGPAKGLAEALDAMAKEK